jgi:hypothetical protein
MVRRLHAGAWRVESLKGDEAQREVEEALIAYLERLQSGASRECLEQNRIKVRMMNPTGLAEDFINLWPA